MRKVTLVITVMILCIALIMPAQGAMKKLAQTGLQFLKIDMSPRAAAMGGSYMMVGADATALFYNPAGIVSSPGAIRWSVIMSPNDKFFLSTGKPSDNI